MSSKRDSALKWWKHLSINEKKHHYEYYKESNFTPASHFTVLTGREVELIYNTHNNIGTTEEVDTIQPHL